MSTQIFATGLVAWLSEKLGVTFYLLGLLLCLMVIDYLSGMAASAIEALDHPDDKSYGWSSRKGAKGIHITEYNVVFTCYGVVSAE